MGGLSVPHRREDVACNVASAGNSCFTRLLPASDFLLPTSSPHRRGVMGGVPPGAKRFTPTTWGARIMGGLWVPHRREDVACNVASAREFSASHVYFLLPTSCFRLRLPTGVGYMGGGAARGAKTFAPYNEVGMDHGWIVGAHRREDVACNVASAGNSCFQLSLPASDFLLPTSSTSCFRLRLPTGVGTWAAEPPGGAFRPLQRGCVDCGWIVGGLWVSHRREDVACNVAWQGVHASAFLLPTSAFLLPTSSPHRRGDMGGGAARGERFAPYNVGCVDCGWIVGRLWVFHRREDVACNVASAGNSCFQLSLPASDFLLPTSSTSCFLLRLPTGVGYGRRCRPGRRRNVGCADRGCPTGVKTLRATSLLHGIPASNFHFLLPTSCFRLRIGRNFLLPTFTSCFLLPASYFFSPPAWGMGGGAARGEDATWGARIVGALLA
jgi:hypothetical protein